MSLHDTLIKNGFHHKYGALYKGRDGHKVYVSGDRWTSKPMNATGVHSGKGSAELESHLGAHYHAMNPERLGYKAMFRAMLHGESSNLKNIVEWLNKEGDRNMQRKSLDEVAPPGREKQVRELKKKFPKGSASPFKIAWASYDKSHHHKEETETTSKDLRDIIVEDTGDDETAAHALVLHGDNEGHLYHTSKLPVMKNLEKRHKNGTYNHDKAKKLWKYHADRVAQDYHHQHGDPRQHWSKAFPPRVRHRAASMWADDHHAEMKHGNYND